MISFYCKDYENIENYEKAKADNFKGWDCHHRREAEFSRKELIALGIYYNVSSEELVFLTRAEHNKLHKEGKPLPDDAKKKISETLKGKLVGENNPAYGRHWYNNGKENKYCYECPDGFTPGRLRKTIS